MSFVIRLFRFILGFWKFLVRYSGLSVGERKLCLILGVMFDLVLPWDSSLEY